MRGRTGIQHIIRQREPCVGLVTNPETHPVAELRPRVGVDVGPGGALEAQFKMDARAACGAQQLDKLVQVNEVSRFLELNVQERQPTVPSPSGESTLSQIVGARGDGAL